MTDIRDMLKDALFDDALFDEYVEARGLVWTALDLHTFREELAVQLRRGSKEDTPWRRSATALIIRTKRRLNDIAG